MTVRAGTPADRAALSAAQQALAEPAPELLASLLGRDSPGTVLVAVDSEPVGYLLALPGPEAVYVPEIAVRSDCQREGHGSALLSGLFARADADEVRLTVAADDESARRFYRSHGFEVRERLPDRFERGDGLLLARPLG